MSGARSIVPMAFTSTPLFSVGGLCWLIAIPIPMPVTSVRSVTTHQTYRPSFMRHLLFLGGVGLSRDVRYGLIAAPSRRPPSRPSRRPAHRHVSRDVND